MTGKTGMTPLGEFVVAALIVIVLGGGLLMGLAIHELRTKQDRQDGDIVGMHRWAGDVRRYLEEVAALDDDEPAAAEPATDVHPAAAAAPATSPAGDAIDKQHAAFIERELGGRTFRFHTASEDS